MMARIRGEVFYRELLGRRAAAVRRCHDEQAEGMASHIDRARRLLLTFDELRGVSRVAGLALKCFELKRRYGLWDMEEFPTFRIGAPFTYSRC
jgi:hypothetical protein